MKIKLIIDEKIAIWSRETVIVEADNYEEAIRKYENEEYETINYEYLTETETSLGSKQIFDDNNMKLLKSYDS